MDLMDPGYPDPMDLSHGPMCHRHEWRCPRLHCTLCMHLNQGPVGAWLCGASRHSLLCFAVGGSSGSGIRGPRMWSPRDPVDLGYPIWNGTPRGDPSEAHTRTWFQVLTPTDASIGVRGRGPLGPLNPAGGAVLDAPCTMALRTEM